MLRRALIAIAVVGLLLVAAYGVAYAKVEVTPNTLGRSVAAEALGMVGLYEPCERRRGRWTCVVFPSSGTATYAVTHKGRCWTARRIAVDSEQPLPPARARGCVSVRNSHGWLYPLGPGMFTTFPPRRTEVVRDLQALRRRPRP